MSRVAALIVTATLAAPAAAARSGGTCEWRKPAHDPFQGDVAAAVDDYADIPAATRARLKARMAKVAYDDIVSIRRDAIEGKHPYEPALLDMHFGKSRICGEVTRLSWRADHEERALAYCEDGHCVVVPLICRNVSRIIRRPAGTLGGPGTGAHAPLTFDPPAAGLVAAPGTPADTAGPNAQPLDAVPPPSTLRPPAGDVPFSATPLQPLPPAAEAPAPANPAPAVPAPAVPPPVVVAPPAEPPGLIPQPGAGPQPILPTPGVPPLPPAAPAVPEPATMLMWAAGLAAVAAWRRRKLS